MKLLAVLLFLASASLIFAIPPPGHHPRGRGPDGNGPPGLHGDLPPGLKKEQHWDRPSSPCGGPPPTGPAPSNGTMSGENTTTVAPEEAGVTSEATAQTESPIETLAESSTSQAPSEGTSETSPTLSTSDGVQSQTAIPATSSESSTSATSDATAEGPPDTAQTTGSGATN
uniref:Putative secreted mucin n=1 Tax=Amblyomma cajennense TaxID=34607 RepID=A0A023FFF6_AMBCJ